MEKLTVILTCWKRFQNFERILRSWLEQEEVNQVIVFDNSGTFETKLPVLVISASQNCGTIAEYACAQFAKNDLIIFADDDVFPKENFAKDLLRYYKEDRVVGIMGRSFTGNSYWKFSGCHAESIREPQKIDQLDGLIMLTHRKNCFVDIRDCPEPTGSIEDFWWQQQLIGTEFYVVPSRNFELLPEGKDENALYKQKGIREMREKYYKKWILKEDMEI